ncbi:MAG: MBL fold metallo-hydrolase [Candidatus Gracilibacteria bacterium]|nr:MBL fold metallo-hydrolase [Candidatus Gracilibacteria bacterium]
MSETTQGLNISFHGAAGEVTGSKHLITTPAGSKILLDCGLFQGKRVEAAEKNKEFGFDPSDIDAVLLSHAHIDHSGLLPKLAKDGFSGKIYTTDGTMDLCDAMLHDSARIQEEDEAYFNRNKDTLPDTFVKREPLYRTEDVDRVLKQFVGVKYREKIQVTPDIEAEFYDAGHVFGSGVIKLTIDTPEGYKKLIFTGDLGRHDMPILNDPEYAGEADYLLIESTYGDRAHEGVSTLKEDLAEIINKTVERGGKIFIPVFALERTQEMILRLEELMYDKKIPSLDIFIDSPLAGKLTKVFEQHPEYYDEDMKERHARNPQVFSFENLKFTESVEESKELNFIRKPCIIMAGSGMMENGRIRHHLKFNIENEKNSLLVVGYQAVETLGRKIVEGQKSVPILGHDFEVKLELKIFKSMSAHADMHALDKYVQSVKGLKKVILIHGEQDSREAFAERIKSMDLGADIVMPTIGEKIDL